MMSQQNVQKPATVLQPGTPIEGGRWRRATVELNLRQSLRDSSWQKAKNTLRSWFTSDSTEQAQP